MVICFDFNKSKILFIKQQNTKLNFAVDFLMSEKKYELNKYLENEFLNNSSIVDILKKEKNFLVLPDEVVGYDMFSVPTVKFGKNQYFETKFNSLYNKSNTLNVYCQVLEKQKEQTSYNFYYLKKEVIESVITVFKRFNINLTGITFYSQCLIDFVFSSNKQITKGNSIVIFNSNNLKKYVAIHNGIILGFWQTNDKFDGVNAKKYSNTLKLRRRTVKAEDAEEVAMLTKYKLELSQEEHFVNQLKDFECSFKSFKFETIYLLNFKDNIKQYLEYSKVYEINLVTEEQILSKCKTNVFVQKRGFWL